MAGGSNFTKTIWNLLKRLKGGRMDKEQARRIKAIQGSIRKWVDIAYFKGIDRGGDNCDLCQEFTIVHRGACCIYCPIFQSTGYAGCNKTPYARWSVHQLYAHPDQFSTSIALCPECVNLAKQEIEFLESILAKELEKVIDAA
jgi:hypothetical protein